MANLDSYGNPINPTTGTTIAKEWGDAVANRVVKVFADSTERDLAITSPVEGMLIYLETNELQVYNGATWVTLVQSNKVQGISGGHKQNSGGLTLTASYQVAATETIALPTGWTTMKVIAWGTVQYANVDANFQMSARMAIDTSDGSGAQSGVTASGGEASSSPTHSFDTSASSITVALEVRADSTNKGGTMKYANFSYILVRVA
ncbi:MAG: hypothetical protein DWP92_01635 [Armatimonadetes bacterium]|nr:MAG: hypothetical protein DWP92_01635 [Armatimonadota bacterium]